MNANHRFLLGMLVFPLAMLGLGIVYASDVATPNTFVSGTPAVAAEINANFAAHEAAINDNDARIDGVLDPAPGGLAKATAFIRSDGTVHSSTNSLGGTPTVNHISTGVYEITFPGAGDMSQRAPIATPFIAECIRVAPGFSGGLILVETFDLATAAPVDSGFYVVIH